LVYAGCDLGAVSAKVAIVENSDILAFAILPYRSHPRQAAVEAMDRALAQAGLSAEQIERCLSTGFGEKAVPYADGVIPEIVCLPRAVTELNPRVRTIVDVGGYGCGAISIDNEGHYSESAITDKCVAGIGKFIEVMAKALEMPLDELIQASLSSRTPALVTNQCVVFAESEVISLVNDGRNRVDIFAGIARFVAAKITGLVGRVDVEGELALAGGVAKNSIVVREVEQMLGLKLADLGGCDPQLLGAYGAALMAQ
jgi:predicted CoA-substrate-specific enzyme activase